MTPGPNLTRSEQEAVGWAKAHWPRWRKTFLHDPPLFGRPDWNARVAIVHRLLKEGAV